jgi:LmbE family N-acetylglucosaminyl deacetylase
MASVYQQNDNIMTTQPRLLIAYAHPDDESFGLGGLIAKYVERGVLVDLICATNGDVGTIAPEFMDGYATTADRRLFELDCAARTLRLNELVKLGYKDSGMMGSPDNADPSCLWQAPVEAVTRRVVEVIRRLQPQVIITFNRYGGYGHPDHIAIQRATTQAFHLAGDAGYDTGQAPYQPQKLYYSSILKRMLQIGIWRTILQRKDPRHLGRNKDIDLVAILDHIEPIHAAIDIRSYYAAWDEASACHASQLGGGFPRLPTPVRKLLMPWQGFTRIYPAPTHNRIDERDLFDSVRLDLPASSPLTA